MIKSEWPRWRFHKEQCPEGIIVRSDEQSEKLGAGWVDSPSQFEEEKPSEKPASSYQEHMSKWESKEEKKEKPKRGKKKAE